MKISGERKGCVGLPIKSCISSESSNVDIPVNWKIKIKDWTSYLLNVMWIYIGKLRTWSELPKSANEFDEKPT